MRGFPGILFLMSLTIILTTEICKGEAEQLPFGWWETRELLKTSSRKMQKYNLVCKYQIIKRQLTKMYAL